MADLRQTYGEVDIDRPLPGDVPEPWRERVGDLFTVMEAVRGRNRLLTSYYTMKVPVRGLGISIPPSLERVNSVVGWCAKAVQAHAMRSIFDGYVFGGEADASLDSLVRANRMRSLYQRACAQSLVHGVSALSVMRGGPGQPEVKVRSYSANQFSALWDKEADRIGCALVLSDVDRDGHPSRYVAHFEDAVLTLSRDGEGWACEVERNIMGRPLVEVLVNDPDDDRPLGHSMLTPELLGIVDKAMRDVLRMEIGAEFFTFPQRYILGADDDLFSAPPEPGAPVDEDGDPVGEDGEKLARPADPMARWFAYVGSILALTRDENGELPTVGQFSPTTAENFTMTFENDAQRFSGATNVPLAQLGVLSSTYTSSDALGAANDPLILEVETMNRRNAEAMEEVARMMMAVQRGVPMSELPEGLAAVQAYMKDPSQPTLAACADATSKFIQSDDSVKGTRVSYEMYGLSQPTIDRLEAEKSERGAIAALNELADAAKASPAQGGGA